jgi:peptidoglycan-associated lipoprotein
VTTGQVPTKPAPNLTQDQQVSPNIAVAGDIISACGIKAAPASGSPKFDYDKEELTPEDRAVLDQIATCLTTGALKGRAVDLIGRADPRGTEEYNLGLGSRRAGSVSAYLGRLGVGQPQMMVTTRGALDATGSDDAGYAQDRRVDIQLQANKG